ncbi:MAG TPA: MerR family DNA-binding protein, partial [candidate division Zixibacteria bacterium]|nr:MerR family DNA-binding protein [candidate division Zixibacteria bacterium]
YGADAVAMLRFTRHAKSAGFTLSEIKRLTQLIDGRERQCGKMRAFLQRKLERLTAQIAELQTVRESLATLRQLCEDADELADCPALESLMSGRPVRGHES